MCLGEEMSLMQTIASWNVSVVKNNIDRIQTRAKGLVQLLCIDFDATKAIFKGRHSAVATETIANI